MQQIEPGILYNEKYLGVTVGGLVFPHGTIMVDSPIRIDDANAWRSQLLNQRRGSNRLLVLLDSHPDRALGVRSMDSTVIAHQDTAEVFRNQPMIFKGVDEESGAIWEIYNEAIGMRWATPDITFSDRVSLYWGGPEVVLEYHPGPSKGSIWVILPELQVIFVGDTVLIDQPVFLADADLDAWVEALDVLKTEYKKYTLICGRGGVTDVKAVQAQSRYIKRIIRAVEKLADKEAPPEATEKLVPPLLRGLNFANKWQDLYAQRLRHGLYQYYLKNYCMSETSEPVKDGEEH
jgi:glyoxylase-like metal-dependent hydrolase (beta-lactamase superfamily II)